MSVLHNPIEPPLNVDMVLSAVFPLLSQKIQCYEFDKKHQFQHLRQRVGALETHVCLPCYAIQANNYGLGHHMMIIMQYSMYQQASPTGLQYSQWSTVFLV